MTKRFSNTDNGFIVDYKSEQKVLNLYDVVDVLNELATKCSQLEKENEQLKKENEELENKFEVLEGKLWNCRNVR